MLATFAVDIPLQYFRGTAYGYEDKNGVRHIFGDDDDPNTVNLQPDGSGYFSVILKDDGNGNYTEMKINERGDYTLTVHGKVNNAEYDDIKILLRDNDGDELSGKIEINAYEEPPMVMSRSVMDDDVLGEHHFSLTGLVDDIKHNEIDKLLDNPVQTEVAGEHAFTNDFYSPSVDTGIDEAARAAQQMMLTTM